MKFHVRRRIINEGILDQGMGSQAEEKTFEWYATPIRDLTDLELKLVRKAGGVPIPGSKTICFGKHRDGALGRMWCVFLRLNNQEST